MFCKVLDLSSDFRTFTGWLRKRLHKIRHVVLQKDISAKLLFESICIRVHVNYLQFMLIMLLR